MLALAGKELEAFRPDKQLSKFVQAYSCKHVLKHQNADIPLEWGCVCSVAKASCRAQIETARAVASDLGEGAAREVGLTGWAKAGISHSERDVQRLITEQRSKLDVRVSFLKLPSRIVEWIRPRTWFQFFMRKGLWHRLAGLEDHDRRSAPDVWSCFWRKYRLLHPDFEAFALPGLDFSRIVGIYVHGDEGRSLKRQAWMVTSLQSALGFGFATDKRPPCMTFTPPRCQDDDIPLHVNYLGHTFTTRFICSMVPKKYYEDDKGFYDEILDNIVEDLRDLFENGLEGPGGTYRVLFLGCKGDWPYLVKAGRLKRNFNTSAKRGYRKEVLPEPGMCHCCLAGRDNYPYEAINTLRPAWLTTIGAEVPWSIDAPPAFTKLPHNLSNPGSIFCPDTWHTFHLGVGRTFIASTLAVALPLCSGSNNEERFADMTASYVAARSCRHTCPKSRTRPSIWETSYAPMDPGRKEHLPQTS